MNRFKYAPNHLFPNENTLLTKYNVRLYDGTVKTQFEGGELIITTHRLLWGPPGLSTSLSSGDTCLSLDHALIQLVEIEAPGAFRSERSSKVLLHLANDNDNDTTTTSGLNSQSRPVRNSVYNFIKLSFKDGYTKDIWYVMNQCLETRIWEQQQQSSGVQNNKPSVEQFSLNKLRTGIVGIERSLQEKQKATSDSINVAFQDLNKLMSMAKEMVKLSKGISTKIKEKHGNITEDETVQFKSYLLSLGIDDPVTRDAYKSDNLYYRNLAKELSNFLLKHVEEMGGMMALTDVFCRINRARGFELLSPEDVLNACQLLETLDLPLKLFQFTSGVKVLQLTSLDSESIAEATNLLIQDNGSLTAEELSKNLGISITLAKERLITAEKYGKCCRDDSIEGLKFYPNLFLTNSDN